MKELSLERITLATGALQEAIAQHLWDDPDPARVAEMMAALSVVISALILSAYVDLPAQQNAADRLASEVKRLMRERSQV